MILFFETTSNILYLVESKTVLDKTQFPKLEWLFGNAKLSQKNTIEGSFIGPRANMITPWSTNAVEITQNMLISGIDRIEKFIRVENEDADFDPMLSQKYNGLNQKVFDIDIVPEPIKQVHDISAYNLAEGLSLSKDEVDYLQLLSEKIERPLTDSEVFGFSQVNSEHCRHKIFNGTFIIDGDEKADSLFKLIKKTSREHPNEIVSAYKDNVAFINGPRINQFAPEKPNVPSNYKLEPFESVISLKAETHNFPTTVEPFNGAATGSGGEI